MRRVVLALVVACNAPPAPAPVVPASSVEHADTCQHEIPDCEAACALREVHRLDHIDWFDRRCAAVVLGKNPDRAVGYVAPEIDLDASTTANDAVSCDPPYELGTDGRKKWRRECFR